MFRQMDCSTDIIQQWCTMVVATVLIKYVYYNQICLGIPDFSQKSGHFRYVNCVPFMSVSEQEHLHLLTSHDGQKWLHRFQTNGDHPLIVERCNIGVLFCVRYEACKGLKLVLFTYVQDAAWSNQYVY